MIPDLKKRNFLKLLDFTPEEIRYLLNLAAELKAEKYDGTERALSPRHSLLSICSNSVNTDKIFRSNDMP